eukprot:JP446290.1.p2 GENE.JP446290.1~~JP446290.1.p2  ORF type:complete len:171 (+),score=29.44 JP446290.1:728-1240(+)
MLLNVLHNASYYGPLHFQCGVGALVTNDEALDVKLVDFGDDVLLGITLTHHKSVLRANRIGFCNHFIFEGLSSKVLFMLGIGQHLAIKKVRTERWFWHRLNMNEDPEIIRCNVALLKRPNESIHGKLGFIKADADSLLRTSYLFHLLLYLHGGLTAQTSRHGLMCVNGCE